MAVTEVLARDWTFTIDGTDVGPEGVKSFKIDDEAVEADAGDFSTIWKKHKVVGRGRKITLDCNYLEDPDTGDRDAGQAALEALALETGADAEGVFVITSPGGTAVTTTVTVKQNSLGGGNNDIATYGFELTVVGAPT